MLCIASKKSNHLDTCFSTEIGGGRYILSLMKSSTETDYDLPKVEEM